jgi:hypothetical protein
VSADPADPTAWWALVLSGVSLVIAALSYYQSTYRQPVLARRRGRRTEVRDLLELIESCLGPLHESIKAGREIPQVAESLPDFQHQLTRMSGLVKGRSVKAMRDLSTDLKGLLKLWPKTRVLEIQVQRDSRAIEGSQIHSPSESERRKQELAGKRAVLGRFAGHLVISLRSELISLNLMDREHINR